MAKKGDRNANNNNKSQSPVAPPKAPTNLIPQGARQSTEPTGSPKALESKPVSAASLSTPTKSADSTADAKDVVRRSSPIAAGAYQFMGSLSRTISSMAFSPLRRGSSPTPTLGFHPLNPSSLDETTVPLASSLGLHEASEKQTTFPSSRPVDPNLGGGGVPLNTTQTVSGDKSSSINNNISTIDSDSNSGIQRIAQHVTELEQHLNNTIGNVSFRCNEIAVAQQVTVDQMNRTEIKFSQFQYHIDQTMGSMKDHSNSVALAFKQDIEETLKLVVSSMDKLVQPLFAKVSELDKSIQQQRLSSTGLENSNKVRRDDIAAVCNDLTPMNYPHTPGTGGPYMHGGILYPHGIGGNGDKVLDTPCPIARRKMFGLPGRFLSMKDFFFQACTDLLAASAVSAFIPERPPEMVTSESFNPPLPSGIVAPRDGTSTVGGDSSSEVDTSMVNAITTLRRTPAGDNRPAGSHESSYPPSTAGHRTLSTRQRRAQR